MIASDFLLPVMGGDVKGDSGGAPAPTVSPLTCQKNNNSNGAFQKQSEKEVEKEGGAERLDDHNPNRGNHLKVAYCLTQEVKGMVERYGENHIGFLTLTFRDNVQTYQEASRRFNSLRTGVLVGRYDCSIGAVERQGSGRLHYHLIVATKPDIRSGCDVGALERRDFKTLRPELRAEWAFWRHTSKKYGFGWCHMLPIKVSGSAASNYVGGYIQQHMGHRQERDKGARLIKYIGFKGRRVTSCRFSWNNDGSRLWRQAVAHFASLTDCRNMEELRAKHGRHWSRIVAASIDWSLSNRRREQQGKQGVELVRVENQRRWK